MTPAPAPAQIDAVSHRLGGGCDRGQGLFFYARDWLNTAFGEGTALLIALVAAVVAAATLSADSWRESKNPPVDRRQ